MRACIVQPCSAQRYANCACAEADPIFAAIEAHSRVYAEILALLDAQRATLRYLRELFARDHYAPFEDDGYRTLMFSTERAIARHCEEQA